MKHIFEVDSQMWLCIFWAPVEMSMRHTSIFPIWDPRPQFFELAAEDSLRKMLAALGVMVHGYLAHKTLRFIRTLQKA